MNGYIYPERGENGRAAIQSALDSAEKSGRGTVVLSGEWTLDGTLYIGESTTLLLEGAALVAEDTAKPVITNSNRIRPRGKTLFGTQRGLSVIGKGVIKGRIDLVNVEDFTVSGLRFEGGESGIILSYATGGRLFDLEFVGAERCILAGVGTRNCFFSDICSEGERESIVFCSDKMADRVVNYFGVDVKNNIVRGLSSKEPIKIFGDFCRDIIAV